MNGTRLDEMPPPSKRKAAEDSNPLTKAAKRAKKEGKASTSSKRKHQNGEEQPNGLVIVRAPASNPIAEAITTPRRPPSRPPSAQAHRAPPQSQQQPTAGPSKPPSKKFKSSSSTTSSARPTAKPHSKLPVPPTPIPEEDELAVEEDVRRMDQEADSLRKQSQLYPQPSTRFDFSSPAGTRTMSLVDSMELVAGRETPRIERNRAMRELGVAGTPEGARRRASGGRGKRISSSFENSGVIAYPHTSVADSSLYKHIDADLPESQRARQLLIWCAARSMDTPPFSTGTPRSKKKQKQPPALDPSLPPLTPEEAQILKEVQEKAIRLLASGMVDTDVYGQDRQGSKGKGRADKEKGWLKPNEQNVKNLRRQVEFEECIAGAEQEDREWTIAEEFYKSFQLSVLTPSSSRAKGKEKEHLPTTRDVTPERSERSFDKVRAATPDGKIRRAGTPKRGTTPELKMRAATPQPTSSSEKKWVPRRWDDEKWEDELPAGFRGPGGIELAKRVLADQGTDVLGNGVLKEVEFMVDHLESFTYSAAQAVLTAEEMLDKRYGMITQRLDALSSLGPPSQGPLHPTPSSTEDPQDLLRALARVDNERPPQEVGDAARRAKREAQRGAGGPERRLTNVDVVMGTPKRSGTPRRERTPGRDR